MDLWAECRPALLILFALLATPQYFDLHDEAEWIVDKEQVRRTNGPTS